MSISRLRGAGPRPAAASQAAQTKAGRGPAAAQGAAPLCILFIAAALAAHAADIPGVARVLDIAPVWAGHPVGFDLLTSNGNTVRRIL